MTQLQYNDLIQYTPRKIKWSEMVKSYPRLTYAGYGLLGETRICGMSTGADWQEQRDMFLKPSDVTLLEVAKARAWLVTKAKIKSCNKAFTSYGLKHSVERWLEKVYTRDQKIDLYVSNGSFIAAAILEDFKISGLGNIYINISSKSVRESEP